MTAIAEVVRRLGRKSPVLPRPPPELGCTTLHAIPLIALARKCHLGESWVTPRDELAQRSEEGSDNNVVEPCEGEGGSRARHGRLCGAGAGVYRQSGAYATAVTTVVAFFRCIPQVANSRQEKTSRSEGKTVHGRWAGVYYRTSDDAFYVVFSGGRGGTLSRTPQLSRGDKDCMDFSSRTQGYLAGDKRDPGSTCTTELSHEPCHTPILKKSATLK